MPVVGGPGGDVDAYGYREFPGITGAGGEDGNRAGTSPWPRAATAAMMSSNGSPPAAMIGRASNVAIGSSPLSVLSRPGGG